VRKNATENVTDVVFSLTIIYGPSPHTHFPNQTGQGTLAFGIPFIRVPLVERHSNSRGEITDIGGRREEQGVVQRVFEVRVCGVELAGCSGVVGVWEAKEGRVSADSRCWAVEGGAAMETVLVGYPCVDAAVGMGV
jgi:hypothetical protein